MTAEGHGAGGAPLDLPSWQDVDVPGYGPGIEMLVDGMPLWFASRDTALVPGPEAATCILAYPCLVEGRPLRYPAAAPGDRFLDNVRSATALMGNWWGHAPAGYAVPGPRPAPRGPAGVPMPAGAALFFSGGIDSFYSLTRYPGIGALVFLRGFDVRLANGAAADRLGTAFQRIADDRGIPLLTVATNLREHPTLGRLRWPRYHGSLLAAVAHLLRHRIANFVISSSYPEGNLMPWGSHPELDPLWGDDRLTIIHFGWDRSRAEKLVSMAGEELVHRELRVCYPAPTVDGNCGHCEKCVRTRLTYRLALPGTRCTAIPDAPPLPAAIDALAPLWPQTLLEDYRQLLARAAGEDDVTRSLRALIERSERKMQLH